MHRKTGVLLVNLGTPNSPQNRDVYRYLIEFLTDPRVIDGSWLRRQLLVRGIIVPFRYRQSARCYQDIWTPEGSPLKVYGYRVANELQKELGSDFHIELAMRYQLPSIEQAVEKLLARPLERLLVIPLFPHYASATTGSIHQKVMEVVAAYDVIPEVKFLSHYPTEPGMIQTFCELGQALKPHNYDHIIFSFHGLPETQIRKANVNPECLTKGCCARSARVGGTCYSAQCYATAYAIAEKMGLQDAKYSIAFQSRLGKSPWLQPYLSEMITQLAKQGKKRLLIFCPSFVCDCLETLYEIGVEYAKEFKHAGGEHLQLVPGLNDHPQWIKTLANMIMRHTEYARRVGHNEYADELHSCRGCGEGICR